MWLYVPKTSRSSTSQRVRACSPQQLSLLAPRSECVPEPSAFVSGTHVLRPVSWQGWKARPYIQLLSGITSGHWIANRGAARWIFSVQAIRANRFPRPASSLDTAIRATFGPQCVTRLRELNPASCSWRTWKATLEREPAKYFGISSGLAIALRRDCSRRLKLARRTNASGCSFSAWQTPRVTTGAYTRDQGKAGNERASLIGEAESWPSPRAEDSQSCGNHPQATDSLQGAISTWATPTATAGNRGAYRKATKGGRLLERDIEIFPDTLQESEAGPIGLLLQKWTRPECPRLNPRFDAWLLGWPPGLTRFDWLEMESIHLSRPTRLSPSGVAFRKTWKKWRTETIEDLNCLIERSEPT